MAYLRFQVLIRLIGLLFVFVILIFPNTRDNSIILTILTFYSVLYYNNCHLEINAAFLFVGLDSHVRVFIVPQTTSGTPFFRVMKTGSTRDSYCMKYCIYCRFQRNWHRIRIPPLGSFWVHIVDLLLSEKLKLINLCAVKNSEFFLWQLFWFLYCFN